MYIQFNLLITTHFSFFFFPAQLHKFKGNILKERKCRISTPKVSYYIIHPWEVACVAKLTVKFKCSWHFYKTSQFNRCHAITAYLRVNITMKCGNKVVHISWIYSCLYLLLMSMKVNEVHTHTHSHTPPPPPPPPHTHTLFQFL